MRKLLLASLMVLSLVCGCGSSGYGSKYTLYRSRMMSPPGFLYEQDSDRPLDGPRDPDECQYLTDAYMAWRP